MAKKKGGLKAKFKARRNELQERVQESIEDTGGFSSVIDMDIARKLSQNKEIKIWKMKEGDHLIDVIPFFTGTQHSMVGEDVPAYNVGYWAHFRIGPGDETYVCRAKTKQNGKAGACPICEYISKNNISKDTDEELYAALRPKRRVLYLVWVHNSEVDENLGVQVLDTAYFFMEEKLKDIAKRPRQGGSILFADLEIGKSIAFSRNGTGVGTRVVGHRFDDRLEEIPENIYEQEFPLDMILKMDTTYNDISTAFYQGINTGTEVEEEEDEKT